MAARPTTAAVIARSVSPPSRAGVQARYHDDIDALNLAWWTSFWSRRYTAWDQIIPSNTGIGALMVNWQRFCSEQALDFLRHEIRAVRAHSDAHVTTNLAQRRPWPCGG